MLSLLLCSEAHAKALIAFLKTAHVPQETSADQFKDFVSSLTADNGLGFSDAGNFSNTLEDWYKSRTEILKETF